MPRKTREELSAERERVEAARRAEEAKAYPAKLMAALEEATTKNNYELTVVNGVFSLRDRDASRDPALSLTAAYTANSQNALENLEWDLQTKAEERAEEERRYAVKQAALNKLTEEEKELLGL